MSMPNRREAMQWIAMSVLAGCCGLIAIFMVSIPMIVAVLGWKAGMPFSVLTIMLLPAWADFVIERLYRMGILSVMSAGRIAPANTDLTR